MNSFTSRIWQASALGLCLMAAMPCLPCRAQSADPTSATFDSTKITGMRLLIDGRPWKINSVQHDYYNNTNHVTVFCDEGTLELNVAYETPKARAGYVLDKDHKAQATLDVKQGEGKKTYGSIFTIGDKRGEPAGWAKNGCGPVWFNCPELGTQKPYQAACDLTLYADDMKTVRVVLTTTGRLESWAEPTAK